MNTKIPSWLTILLLAASAFICEPVQAQFNFQGARDAAARDRAYRNSWNSGGNNGGNGSSQPSGPSAAQIAAQQAAAEQQQRNASARTQNNAGLSAWNKGDWANAVADFQRALQNNPNDSVIRDNLQKAQAKLSEANANAQREQEQRQQDKSTVNNMQQAIQGFAQTLNTAPSTIGTDFDGRNAGNLPNNNGNSGGLDFTATIPTPSQTPPASALSLVDSSVVDARHVPSGLPKPVENAIAAAYPDAPPGVSDRLRKGFQAVMDHDWKVAKAWFGDALNHDPNNAALKRLVVIVDDSAKPATGKLQLPQDSDMELLFDLKATPTAKASANAKTSGGLGGMSDDEMLQLLFPGLKDLPKPTQAAAQPATGKLQLPQDSDMELLFDLKPVSTPKPKMTVGDGPHN